MPGPIEFRYFLKKATIEDIANGAQPLRQATASGPQMFLPPVLQYRYREKDKDGEVQWSPFYDINYEREGDPPPH